jgi:hypothetical protein
MNLTLSLALSLGFTTGYGCGFDGGDISSPFCSLFGLSEANMALGTVAVRLLCISTSSAVSLLKCVVIIRQSEG